MNWRPIRGWTRLLHEREMKADSMPERLLIGPGSPPSLDPVYPELSPPLEPCPHISQHADLNFRCQEQLWNNITLSASARSLVFFGWGDTIREGRETKEHPVKVV
jgi:hypothetical protein